MRIEYTLKPIDRSVLRILNTTGKTSYLVLKRIAGVLESGELDLQQFVRALSELANQVGVTTVQVGTAPRITQFEHRLETALAALCHLGLIERSDTESNVEYSWIFGGAAETRARESARYYALTVSGQEIAKRIEAGRRVIVRPAQSTRNTVFIASAFGQSDTDCLFKKVLQDVCADLGYKAIRVDMGEPAGTITEAILKGITDAEALIADLTYARPSVYFEIGYAYGLGLPLLLTGREDHQNGTVDALRIHFDLAQFKISFWRQDDGDGVFHWQGGMTPRERLAQLIQPRPMLPEGI